MPHFKTVLEAQMYNTRKRKEREIQASVFRNDKLRVVPTCHQNFMHGRQVLTFRPTDVIDDPHRIKLMDELRVEYRVLSRLRRTRSAAPSEPPATDEIPDDTAPEIVNPLEPVPVNGPDLETTGATSPGSITEPSAMVVPSEPLATDELAADEWKPAESEA